MIAQATRSIALILACMAPVASEAQQGNSGSYLAARQAGYTGDYRAAATYFTRALTLDARNVELLDNALTAQVSLGRFDHAAAVMTRLQSLGADSPLANVVQLTQWLKGGDLDALQAAYGDGFSLGGLLDGLVTPWAALAGGDADAALAGFDQLGAETGLGSLAAYHKALALASLGRFDEAQTILDADQGGISGARRGVLAQIEVLSQLGRNQDALDLIEARFGNTASPVFMALAERLEAGETLPFTIAPDATAGIAEAFYTMGQALLGEGSYGLVLIYSRTAAELNPAHTDALLLSARILEEQGQHDLAIAAYDQVSRDDPAYMEAEFGRADALRAADRMDAAVEVLKNLAGTYPDMLQAHVALADTYRRTENWEGAEASYTHAIELADDPQPQDWQLWFARGVTRERLGTWPEAEADFRKALELSPQEPRVLNYLGYSLVEKRSKLDEALSMIEMAVRARPSDGYIVDSLAWVNFRLGHYEEAVAPMERAAELMPVDPVINDHLGDVYWAVGREREARFMWRRALSFVDYGTSSEEVDPDRIRRKLDVGLDAVLEEEGAAPLHGSAE